MKITITGALGYVGGRLMQHFAKLGHEVIALSRKADVVDVRLPANVSLMTPAAYRANADMVKRTDAIIHLASLNEHDCVKYPQQAVEVNIGETVQWLDLAQQNGIGRFVYFSTAHVYARPLIGFFDESSMARPVHPYAITHRCAEDYVLAYRLDKNMNGNTVIRLTNAFGGPAYPTADRWTLLVNDLCKSAVEKGEMVLLSDGLQPRDFICLEDVCRAVEHLLLQRDLHDVYNLGSGTSVTVWDMAKKVKRTAEDFMQRKISLVRKEPPANATSATLTMDISRLAKTGFVFQENIDEEIKSTLSYFTQHKV